MPQTCCIPVCRSGYDSSGEKVSFFALPTDPTEREKWKRVIPRKEDARFSFDSKWTRVCERHFHPSDIIRDDEFVVRCDAASDEMSVEKVAMRRDRPKLRPGAIPGIIEGCPLYLNSRKSKSREVKCRPTSKPPSKRKRTRSTSMGSKTATTSNADSGVKGSDPHDADHSFLEIEDGR